MSGKIFLGLYKYVCSQRFISQLLQVKVSNHKSLYASGGTTRALRVRKPTVYIPPTRAVTALTPQAEKILKDEKNRQANFSTHRHGNPNKAPYIKYELICNIFPPSTAL